MSKKINDGGPAFPVVKTEDWVEVSSSLTVRDYFAAKLAAAWLSTYGENSAHPAGDLGEHPEWPEVFAKQAYTLADAMLKAREA